MPPDQANKHVDVAIVGGGISGLYCALELAECACRQQPLFIGGRQVHDASGPPSIGLYEMRPIFGGRIETWTVDLQSHQTEVATVDQPYGPGLPAEAKLDYYRAEFGPMRIEPRDQPMLGELLEFLDIREPAVNRAGEGDLVKFPAYGAEVPVEPKYTLLGEEAEQHSLLDLLLLAMRRIFELASETEAFAQWPTDRPRSYWNQFMGRSSVRKHYWKGELHDFIISLGDRDYDFIRRNLSVNGTPLHDMGFWNLLSEVLSHLAVLRIRDWGSYYHR